MLVMITYLVILVVVNNTTYDGDDNNKIGDDNLAFDNAGEVYLDWPGVSVSVNVTPVSYVQVIIRDTTPSGIIPYTHVLLSLL